MVHHKTIQVGTLVLLLEENLPPLPWTLSRVTEVIPAVDGIVRAVVVKRISGLLKKAVDKTCALFHANKMDNIYLHYVNI